MLGKVITALVAFALAWPIMLEPADAQQLRLLGIAIPDRVAGLRHEPPHDFEKDNPGFGYSVRFIRDGWLIDVFVYDLKLKAIPGGPASSEVSNELKRSAGEIREIERRGDYSNVKQLADYTISDRKGARRFACSGFTYFHKGAQSNVTSELCLTGIKNRFFKIRATARATASSSSEAKRFVSAWADVLASQ